MNQKIPMPFDPLILQLKLQPGEEKWLGPTQPGWLLGFQNFYNLRVKHDHYLKLIM